MLSNVPHHLFLPLWDYFPISNFDADMAMVSSSTTFSYHDADRSVARSGPSRPRPDISQKKWLDDAIVLAATKEKQGSCMPTQLYYSMAYECSKQRDIERGRQVQSLILYSKLNSLAILADHLIRLFASCESMAEANIAFNRVSKPSQYTWNAIVEAYASSGHIEMGLLLYSRMEHSNIRPDKFTFSSILKICGRTCSIQQGRRIQEQWIDSNLQSNVVDNTLIDMYASCGCLEEANRLLDQLPSQDIISWNAMIAGYVDHHEEMKALRCFHDMQQDGKRPDKFTYPSILKACGRMTIIEQGRCIHEQILESGLQSDDVIGSALVDMYAKCGNLDEACIIFCRLSSQSVASWNAMVAAYVSHGNLVAARNVFDQMRNRDIVSWNAIIAGYAQYGECHLALACFDSMQHSGIKPDKVTFLSILKVCSSIGAMQKGKNIHHHAIESMLESNSMMANTLIDMYAKCGNLDAAYVIFVNLPSKNVVSWNAIIAGFAQHGQAGLSLQCFDDMQSRGIKPDDVTFNGVLTAFNRAGLLEEGLQAYKSMKQKHGINPTLVHVTCIIDLLGHEGHFGEAEALLKSAPVQPDLCLWITLLSACRVHGNIELGIRCFDAVMCLYPSCAAAYMLMTEMYASCLVGEDCLGVKFGNSLRSKTVENLGSIPLYAMLKKISKSLNTNGPANVLFQTRDLSF